MNTIHIITATLWNMGPVLPAWFSSVYNLIDPPGYSMIPVIVDNGSDDSTTAALYNALDCGVVSPENVHLLPEYVGFSRAQNYALKKAILDHSCVYVATLDCDTVVDIAWLTNLVKAADDDRRVGRNVGMWSGPVYNPDSGRISTAGHCVRDHDGACLDIDFGNSPPKVSATQDYEPFCPCFTAALWSTEMLLETGLPDAEQFIYYDDIDLGFKARLKGWRARWVPEAKAWHPPNRPTQEHAQHLTEGRIALALRYAPNSERTDFLESLNSDDRAIYDEMKKRRHNLEPVGGNELRTKIWKLALQKI